MIRQTHRTLSFSVGLSSSQVFLLNENPPRFRMCRPCTAALLCPPRLKYRQSFPCSFSLSRLPSVLSPSPRQREAITTHSERTLLFRTPVLYSWTRASALSFFFVFFFFFFFFFFFPELPLFHSVFFLLFSIPLWCLFSSSFHFWFRATFSRLPGLFFFPWQRPLSLFTFFPSEPATRTIRLSLSFLFAGSTSMVNKSPPLTLMLSCKPFPSVCSSFWVVFPD